MKLLRELHTNSQLNLPTVPSWCFLSTNTTWPQSSVKQVTPGLYTELHATVVMTLSSCNWSRFQQSECDCYRDIGASVSTRGVQGCPLPRQACADRNVYENISCFQICPVLWYKFPRTLYIYYFATFIKLSNLYLVRLVVCLLACCIYIKLLKRSLIKLGIGEILFWSVLDQHNPFVIWNWYRN